MKQLIASLLVFCLALPPAMAGTKPKVLFVDFLVPPSDLVSRAQLRSEMKRSLANSSKIAVVSDADVDQWLVRQNAQVGKSRSTEDPLRSARDSLAKGKRLYDALKFNASMKELERARREFILNLSKLRSNRDLIDAHLYLGMSYVALKQNEKARAEFLRVVYLDPKRELSGRDYSPQVRSIFSKAKQDVLAEDPIRVRIESEPAGSIYLNGKFLGQTPFQTQMQPGEYFILVEREGLDPWFEPVTLKRPVEVVQAKLRPARDDLRLSQGFRVREGSDQSDDQMAMVVDAAKTLGADIVFLGSLQTTDGYRLLGQFYDARTSDFSQVAVISLGRTLSDFSGASQDLVEELVKFIRSDGYVRTGLEGGSPEQTGRLAVGGGERPVQENVVQAPPKRWYEHWWIYPILLGVGAGAFLGARQLRENGNSSKVILDNKGNF